MLRNLTSFGAKFYVVSYIVECFISYLMLFFYYVKKNKKAYNFMIFLFFLTGILMLFVVSLSPNIQQAMFLGGLWGTSAIVGLVIYFISRMIKKE